MQHSQLQLKKTKRQRIFLFAALSLLALFGLATAQNTSIPDQARNAYENGNYALAASLWQPLADTNYAEAQYAIGVMHLRGEGVVTDPQQAMTWFERAAKQNHVGAMFNLGIAYWRGEGVQQNHAQAVTWWRRAAVLNDAASQYNLGFAYYNGMGVEKDLLQAAYWVQEAAQKNHPNASQLFNEIETIYPDIAQQFKSAPLNTMPNPLVLDNSRSNSNLTMGPIPAPPIDFNATQTAPVELNPAENAQQNQPLTNQAKQSAHLAMVDTNVHTGPAENTPILEAFAVETPVDIINEQAGWLRINYPGERYVWVYGDYVAAQGDVGLVVAGRLNARPQPSTGSSSKPVGQFLQGDVVQIRENRSNWLKVVAPDTLTTWVKTENVRIVNNPFTS